MLRRAKEVKSQHAIDCDHEHHQSHDVKDRWQAFNQLPEKSSNSSHIMVLASFSSPNSETQLHGTMMGHFGEGMLHKMYMPVLRHLHEGSLEMQPQVIKGP